MISFFEKLIKNQKNKKNSYYMNYKVIRNILK
ncbi:Hypothetical Protein SLY_0351 [Strawberry lethal yellows phytoplasma (CPA) str. NZSb11]|uniref:Uncharacterized protein n=1 Tax=Strawberry lethal yellows phytoplasma (CPA) str. NZSb11 TaxID=980422 RepID=R4RP60_PHYAS|nr:Hypothetical Protein SLY_0351 [Strawberry lethal yellows phytoplasma (CPA) str. NZSb11]